MQPYADTLTAQSIPALTAADLPYKIHHMVTYREAMDMGTDIITREAEWRRDCLANQAGMSEIARDCCTRDLEVLETAYCDLMARYGGK